MVQKRRSTSSKKSAAGSKTKKTNSAAKAKVTKKAVLLKSKPTGAVKKRTVRAKVRSLKPAHKRFALGTLILLLVAGIGILWYFKIASTQAATNVIVQNIRGGCLDNYHSGTLNGNKIDYWNCNGTGAQKWTVANGQFKNSNGKCLDVPHDSHAVGTYLQLYTCNGTAAQTFALTAAHQIVNRESDLCLDDEGGSTTDGTRIQMYTCIGTKAQVWYVGGIPATALSKQAMAKAIIGSSKAHFLSGASTALSKIASGSSDGNSTPCGMNIKVLEVMQKLLADHSSVGFSDNNALCTGYNSGRSAGSRHWDGNGSAMDVYMLDGVTLDYANSTEINKAKSYISEISGYLSKGSSLSSSSQVGQVECSGFGMSISGVIRFSDACNHVHIDFPPWADSHLHYLSGAW